MALKFPVFLAILVAAAVTDLRQNRIPNRLTLVAFVSGILFGVVQEAGWPGAAVAGAGLALLVTMPLFLLGAIGGGDAKLLAAIGAFLGPAGLVSAALYAGVLGGFMSLAQMARRGVVLPVLLRMKNRVFHAITLGRRGERDVLGGPAAVTIPYGIALAAGALVAWFLPILDGVPR
jgi:prepilin peptidase CpaA